MVFPDIMYFMDEMDKLLAKASEIEDKIGYYFRDKRLLIVAFTHCSYLNEHRDLIQDHNERFEFLGDTVLGLLISDHLYHLMPYTPEGQLSSIRSRLVDANACAGFVKELELGEYILLGKGEKLNDGRGRDSIYADLFEALIGAIYLDGGLEPAKTFIKSRLKGAIGQILELPSSNWKALLQDFSQKLYHEPPHYEVEKAEGPDHNKEFEVVVFVNKKKMGVGRGTSKKEAQQEAARSAMERIHNGESQESV